MYILFQTQNYKAYVHVSSTIIHNFIYSIKLQQLDYHCEK